jgi:hypothetical protein
MSARSIPSIPAEYDVLGAALLLIKQDIYVLPVEPDTKRPAKFLKDKWQAKTSVDPEQIKEWFSDGRYLLGIHVGRSGLIVFDVDDYDLIPAALAEEFEKNPGPWQSTREVGLRGHRVYRCPEDRVFGNGLGKLSGSKWGEIRGMNAIIVVEPSAHTKPGGRYKWMVTGEIPVLSDFMVGLLPNVNRDELGAGSATDDVVKKFIADHNESATKPGFAKVVLEGSERDPGFKRAMNSGSRHEALVKYLVQACREARLGYYQIRPVLDEMYEFFLLMFDPVRDRGRFPKSEFKAALAWAVAQANLINVEERLSRNEQRLGERDEENGWADRGVTTTTILLEDPYDPTAPPTEVQIIEKAPAESSDGFRTGDKNKDGVLRINVGDKASAMPWLREEVGRGQLAGLFLRGSRMLVHTPLIGEEGYVEPKESGADDGPAQVRPITLNGLVSMIETRYDVGKAEVKKDKEGKATGKQWRRTLLPLDLAQRCIGSSEVGDTPNLRTLQGITHTPVMRGDGSIFDRPGYDEATGMLYLPTGGMGTIAVPENPTRAQVEAARDLILFPVSEFPFVTPDDLANWVGCAFTPLLRPMVPPPYQFAVIEAPSPGSGKGYLLGVLREAHGVALRPGMPTKDEEWSKVVMTMLSGTTAPIIAFDNVRGVIHSSVLEGLLTTDTVSDRTLGRNDQFMQVPNDRLWAMTGNNAQIGGDLARRTLRITIDPRVPNPESRTGFKCHPILWTRENRAEYITALLTVARAWVVAGRPMPEVKRSDDYAVWVKTIRGILEFAGFPGTFSNAEQRKERSAEDEEWAIFLEAIVDSFGTETAFTSKELYAQIMGNSFGKPIGTPIDPMMLPGDLAEKFGSWNDAGKFVKSLGLWLKNRIGRYAGDLKVADLGKGTTGSRKNVQIYQIERSSKINTGALLEIEMGMQS